MGSFAGHVLPGVLFLLLGVWWTIQIFRRFYKSLCKGINSGKYPGYYGTATFPLGFRRCSVDLESYVMLFSCALGLLVETIGALIRAHHIGTNNIQHATMYFFFGMVPLSAVLLPKLKVIPRCDDVVYFMLCLSFVVEGLLFKFHLFGRDDLDVVMHTLLVYTIFACATVTLLEVTHRHSIWPPLARAFFTCLQGTWFCQVAFILYPPLTNPWGHHQPEQNSSDTHGSVMFITCVYAWHMAVISILMIICSLCIGCFYRKKGWIDEEALMDRHYAHRVENMGYSTLQQNCLEQNDEL